jgi:hypothetical protein
MDEIVSGSLAEHSVWVLNRLEQVKTMYLIKTAFHSERTRQTFRVPACCTTFQTESKHGSGFRVKKLVTGFARRGASQIPTNLNGERVYTYMHILLQVRRQNDAITLKM